MLETQSLQQLRQLKLTGLAKALEMQFSQPNTYEELSFAERINLAVQQEVTYRHDKRLQRLLKAARFKVTARMEDINYSHPRGLKQSTVAGLQSNTWITKGQNLVMTGPTGCGKTYLACALGHHACLHGYQVRYFRASRMFEQLTISHGDGSYLKLLSQIAKADVLIIDDWGLESLTQPQKNDLLEIMEDRHNSKSTIVTSQLPMTKWHEFISDPTLADAILDRLLHNAHKLNLKGESMRKILTSLTEGDHLK
jgi:DNA replication protein DnaC